MVRGSAPPAPSTLVPVKPRPVQVRQEFLPLRLPAPTIYQKSRYLGDSQGSQQTVRKYVDENGSVAKRSAGVAPEVNLRERVTRTPPPSSNKAAHSGFETQRRRYQKSKTGVSVAPQKGLLSSKFFFKKVRIRLPTLALKPRGDVTGSPKQGYQWTCVHQKFLKNLKTFKSS